MIKFLAVAAGGAIGSVARFATVLAAQTMFGSRLPIGIFLVNCLGTFLFGFGAAVMERYAAEYWRLLFFVGFLGGYTTFSSFAWESYVLYSNGQYLTAILNVLFTNLFSFLLLILGLHMGRIIIAVAHPFISI